MMNSTRLPPRKLKPKIGVIGLGRWGRRLLGPLSEECTIGRICSRGGAPTLQWIQETGWAERFTPRIEDVLDDPTLVAVVVATPADTHFAIASRCLEAGKHVFIEKPICTGSRDAFSLVELARAADRVLFAGHVYEYHPAALRLRELLSTSPAIRASFQWSKSSNSGDDIAFTLLPHDIGLALSLFGEISGDFRRLDDRGDPDVLRVETAFGDTQCEFHFDQSSEEPRKVIRIRTGDCEYVWDGDSLFRHALPISRNQEQPELLLHAPLSSLPAECAAFAACLADRTEGAPAPLTTGRFGARVIEIIERIPGLERNS